MTSERTTRRAVLDAAMQMLDESGWQAVSLRGIARLMCVASNSVVFQVGSKERLRELMADRLFGELDLAAGLPEDPRHRVVELCHRLRRVLLRHRDGALLVTGTNVWEENTLSVSEAVVGALLDAGAVEKSAAHAAQCLEYLVLGLVQEEQHSHDTTSALSPEHYPALARVVTELAGSDFEDRLTFGVQGIVAHALRSSRIPSGLVTPVPASTEHS